ncbi:MAG: hypothetical protein GXY33_15375 [Phycisphaerae bacterium]|nr:hypothetical protein [Phycisphaerae bacterium]
MSTAAKTFSLEEYARRSFNYLTRMVDGEHLPYFHVFWTDPAEAAHDFPDWGDVMCRQLQAATMARIMTGCELPIESIWLEKVFARLDPRTGLFVQPQTAYCPEQPVSFAVQGLVLYTLLTVWLGGQCPEAEGAIRRMIEHLPALVEESASKEPGWTGFGIKSLAACGRFMDCPQAIELAGRLVHQVFAVNPLFSPDNTFRHGGHMHGNLRILSGAAEYALAVGDPELYSRVDALYRYVRSEATSFGFLPEVIGRTGDIVACETCAVMDYLALMVTLANHGHPEYWSDVERLVRNHLVESQVADGAWLDSDCSRADDAQFSRRRIGSRMVGGYAGWSSPNHILAARETMNAHWGGPELKNKTRAFQNCCGGSGTHGLFIAWKNAARYRDEGLEVWLHVDKRLPQAEIRGYQPYQGRLTIELKESCAVKVRVPAFVAGDQMRATVAGRSVETRIWGNAMCIGRQPAGARIEVSYPLTEREEQVSVGNPGRRQYRYQVKWKGDTVIAMTPVGDSAKTGYSEYDQREVEVFYGEDGPGRLYQRDQMAASVEPELSEIHLDEGWLDFWFVR